MVFPKVILIGQYQYGSGIKNAFLTFSNTNIQFAKKKLIWRFYTAAKALPTTKQVELINKKEFAKAALDDKSETFVVHVAALEALPRLAKITIHPSQAIQIAVLK